MNKKVLGLIVIALIIGFSVGIFFRYAFLAKMNVISVSNITIAQQGSIYNNKVIDTYWTVYGNTLGYGSHVFYEFNKSQIDQWNANKFTWNGTSYDVNFDYKIVVDIEVGTPYIAIPLTVTSYTAIPKVYGDHGTITGVWDSYFKEYKEWVKDHWEQRYDGPLNETVVTLYEYNGEAWKIIIPMTINVSKIDSTGKITKLTCDGKEAVYINKVTAETTPLVFVNPANTKEYLKFTLQGDTGGGYGVSYNTFSILNGIIDYAFEKSGMGISQYLQPTQDSFMDYWYTGAYGEEWNFNKDGSIYVGGGYATSPGQAPYYQTLTDLYFYPAKPICLYEDPPWKKGAYCMLSYLKTKANMLQPSQLNNWGLGNEIAVNDQGDYELRIKAPDASWQHTYTIEISTELVNAYVYQTSYAQAKIQKVWWESSGTSDSGKIPVGVNVDKLFVTVENTADWGGIVYLTCKASTSGIGYQGNSHVFQAHETYTFTIPISNYGVTQETKGQLQISAIDGEGTVDDNATATYTLLSGNVVTVTTLNLVVKDTSGAVVPGIVVTIKYGAQTDIGTSDIDGVVSFTLGTYTGTVNVKTIETETYQSTTVDIEVKSGINSKDIVVLKKGEIDWQKYIPYIIVGVVSAIALGTAAYALKRRTEVRW